MKINKNLNHSASHVLAAAVLKLYPDTKIGFGPPTEEGFYYDFEFSSPIIEEDLKKIEKMMKKIIAGGYKVQKVDPIDLSYNEYKKEIIEELQNKNQIITYYGLINPSNNKDIFTDLCKGGHIESVSEIKHFKLLSIAGAYWRGNSNNPQLTRIYGTAWETKDELNEYLNILEDRKNRDHRKLGKEMNIFMFHKLAGQGFPIWLEDGMIIKNEIQKYIRKTETNYGFREVETPAFGERKLYETSGHLSHYQDAMFPELKVDNENLIARPMTCPHHILIYASKRRSYRELPIRMSEQSRLYRYEASGALTGLERVRSMLLTEGHVFARPDQIKTEFTKLYKLIQEVLDKFQIEIDYVSLSLRDKNDKEKYFNDDLMWEDSEQKLREVLDDLKINYQEKIGEAAFYGPKIDIQVKTIIGHEVTLSTLQLDFLLPKKFDIKYIDNNEKTKRPVLIHRGLIGTYERFVSILLEQNKGNFPFWLAPRQVVIIPITEKHFEYAEKVYQQLKKQNIRVFIDKRNERLAKKIRESQISKIKYQIIIGDNEINSNEITIREYGKKEFKKILLKKINSILLEN